MDYYCEEVDLRQVTAGRTCFGFGAMIHAKIRNRCIWRQGFPPVNCVGWAILMGWVSVRRPRLFWVAGKAAQIVARPSIQLGGHYEAERERERCERGGPWRSGEPSLAQRHGEETLPREFNCQSLLV
jgi:hypothetical protein